MTGGRSEQYIVDAESAESRSDSGVVVGLWGVCKGEGGEWE